MMEQIALEAKKAMVELLELANPPRGAIVVVGCSTSEVAGHKIGTHSVFELAQVLVNTMLPLVQEKGLYLAAQCCEHLNRALIIERECARMYGLEEVNVCPQPKAGGSFATAVYASFQDAVAVEDISADCGIDIGGTLIGMHLKKVAVPLRLSQTTIGQATVLAARTRPKFIGGERAHYNERLL